MQLVAVPREGIYLALGIRKERWKGIDQKFKDTVETKPIREF